VRPAEPVTRCALRAGSYHDSVVLMQLQRALSTLPGVLDAGVVMATSANLQLLAAAGLDIEPETGTGARADDLLVAVKAESEAAAAEALSRVDALLRVRPAGDSGTDEAFRPRSLATALKQLPEARWVLVSVPGRYAADVAEDALDLGLNVFLYSDNVPLDREVALKRRARERGLLVLGPDCGTAVLGDVGFGFANRTRLGRIGLIGASGTGLQAVISYLDYLDFGISHAIGTGGRDLSAEVGGITAAQALDLLRRDTETEVIALISKPPAPEVTRRLLEAARATEKPVVVYFLGAPTPGRRIDNVWFASNLEQVADDANHFLDAKRRGMFEPPVKRTAGQRWVRGLFSGGTLALETLSRLGPVLAPVYSNIPLQPEQRLPGLLRSQGHTILDLGADEFTVGRLHPMMDFDLRLRRLRQEAADPEVALILLDLVLGDGSHADPAGELAPVIERLQKEARAAERGLDVAVLVIGTKQDPQDLKLQIQTLERAGARVCRSVSDLVAYTFLRMDQVRGEDPGPAFPPVPLAALHSTRAVINVGVETFAASLAAQGVEVAQVAWRPPAGGNEKMASLLSRMKRRG
jgi:FdrA protein